MAVRLFLSCVSDEFGGYRDSLRRALTRPSVEVKIQEEFIAAPETCVGSAAQGPVAKGFFRRLFGKR